MKMKLPSEIKQAKKNESDSQFFCFLCIIFDKQITKIYKKIPPCLWYAYKGRCVCVCVCLFRQLNYRKWRKKIIINRMCHNATTLHRPDSVLFALLLWHSLWLSETSIKTDFQSPNKNQALITHCGLNAIFDVKSDYSERIITHCDAKIFCQQPELQKSEVIKFFTIQFRPRYFFVVVVALSAF